MLEAICAGRVAQAWDVRTQSDGANTHFGAPVLAYRSTLPPCVGWSKWFEIIQRMGLVEENERDCWLVSVKYLIQLQQQVNLLCFHLLDSSQLAALAYGRVLCRGRPTLAACHRMPRLIRPDKTATGGFKCASWRSMCSLGLIPVHEPGLACDYYKASCAYADI